MEKIEPVVIAPSVLTTVSVGFNLCLLKFRISPKVFALEVAGAVVEGLEGFFLLL